MTTCAMKITFTLIKISSTLFLPVILYEGMIFYKLNLQCLFQKKKGNIFVVDKRNDQIRYFNDLMEFYLIAQCLANMYKFLKVLLFHAEDLTQKVLFFTRNHFNFKAQRTCYIYGKFVMDLLNCILTVESCL